MLLDMQSDDQRPKSDAHDAPATLAQRIKARFGPEVDPRVDLAATLHTPRRQSSSPTAEVYQRLAARSPQSTRYRIEGEIARGGMGAIFEVFDEDLRRKLAMKVVLGESGGDDGAQASTPRAASTARLTRFLEEAQVTGQLDHPGIVPVHELGIDAQGQAFFTMRLVHGRDLSEIFAKVDRGEDGWSLARAVGVLLKVCEAMAYAHSKGVVHRDLKPANVMVGQFGEVYVMDWGLARVLHAADRHDVRVQSDAPAATERAAGSKGKDSSTLLTMDGDVLGTPSYMPPEQARGELAAIDERSDVYAVGAMLYRLLAGRAPYDEPTLSTSAVVVLTHILSRPPTPLAVCAPQASPELVAICEKAMAREKAERYASMLLLAEDLRAWSEGRVVAAYEAGAWAEARKWIRRNRALSFAAAAAILALVGGLSASLWMGERARSNAVLAEERRVAAEANAKEATRQARVAEEVNSFLNDDLLAAIAPEHEGAEVTVRQVLDKAAKNLEGRFKDEPSVEAALRTTIGTSYAKLGDFDAALEHVERAMALRESDALASESERCETMLRTAWVRRGVGRMQEAIDLYEEVIERLESAPMLDSKGISTARNDLALALVDVGRMDDATEQLEQAVALSEAQLGPNDPQTFVAISNLARHESDRGMYETALARLESIVPRQRALIGARHPDAIASLSNLAVVLLEAGRTEDAIRTSDEALEACLEVYGPDHPLTARAHGNVGIGAYSLGRLADAEEHFAESVRIFEAIRPDDHRDLLLARGNLAGAWLDQGRVEKALALTESNLAIEKRVLGESHPSTLRSLNRLAVAYKSLRRYEESERAFREAHERYVEVFGAEHPSAIIALENLGGMMFTQGRLEESERITREVLELRRRVLGKAHPDVSKTTFNLGMLLRAKGDAAGAREQFERALDRDGGRALELNPVAAPALQRLGDLDLAERKHESALAHYDESLQLLRAQQGPSSTVGYTLHQRAMALRGLSRFEESVQAAREALAIRESAHGPQSIEARYSRAAIVYGLLSLERFEECEREALELHANSLREPLPEASFTESVRAVLVKLYEAWGRPEAAAPWR